MSGIRFTTKEQLETLGRGYTEDLHRYFTDNVRNICGLSPTGHVVYVHIDGKSPWPVAVDEAGGVMLSTYDMVFGTSFYGRLPSEKL